MKAEALLAKKPAPSRSEIAHALLGNLCRCTGYTKILDAIELAAAAHRGEPRVEAPSESGIGARVARYRAHAPKGPAPKLRPTVRRSTTCPSSEYR